MIKILTPLLAVLWLGACAGFGNRLEPEPAVDAALATRIKARLVEDETLDAAAIQVESDAGRIRLRGFVETEEQRQHAETLALEQAGVGAVNNEIVVK